MTTTTSEVTLSPLQAHVDAQIDSRISRIMLAEFNKVNTLPNGRRPKKLRPVTPPQTVIDLLKMRQALYNGESAEAISAELTTGEIQHQYIKANEN